MLPIHPTADTQSAPTTTRASYSLFRWYFSAYTLSGIVAGAIAGMLIASVGSAFVVCYEIQGSDAWQVAKDIAEDVMELAPRAGPFGALAGIVCGSILWFFTSCWPALRHPIRAASLCASLGAMLRLLNVAFVETLRMNNPFRMHPDYWKHAGLELVAVLFGGAMFGFLTACIVNLLERRCKRIGKGDVEFNCVNQS